MQPVTGMGNCAGNTWATNYRTLARLVNKGILRFRHAQQRVHRCPAQGVGLLTYVILNPVSTAPSVATPAQIGAAYQRGEFMTKYLEAQ